LRIGPPYRIGWLVAPPLRRWWLSAVWLGVRALRSSRRPRVQRLEIADRAVELRRYPPYSDGGVNGGHVVAIARTADQLTYVSVHGYEHTDVAIAMLVDLLAER